MKVSCGSNLWLLGSPLSPPSNGCPTPMWCDGRTISTCIASLLCCYAAYAANHQSHSWWQAPAFADPLGGVRFLFSCVAYILQKLGRHEWELSQTDHNSITTASDRELDASARCALQTPSDLRLLTHLMRSRNSIFRLIWYRHVRL